MFIKNRLTEKKLGKTLTLFCKRNYHFLSKKNEENKYKHNRIIQALRYFKHNIKYLFMYQKYLKLSIPNITNHIDDGVNTKLKNLNRIDRKNEAR